MEASDKEIYSRASLQSPYITKIYKCLEFDYFMSGEGMGQLMVLSETETHERNVLWLLLGDQQYKDSQWKHATVNISSIARSFRVSSVCLNFVWVVTSLTGTLVFDFRSCLCVKPVLFHVFESHCIPF